jgi:hypothetical protein
MFIKCVAFVSFIIHGLLNRNDLVRSELLVRNSSLSLLFNIFKAVDKFESVEPQIKEPQQ